MKKKKKVLIEHDIEYKRVPHIGTCGWVAIIGVVFLIGLAVYYKYFMGREILTCTQDSTIVLNDKTVVNKLYFKLNFKDKQYVDGNMKIEYDLIAFTDDEFNKYKELELCNKIFIPNDKDRVYKYTHSNCNESINGRKITTNSNYDIKNETGEVKILSVKESFENVGYKCDISK